MISIGTDIVEIVRIRASLEKYGKKFLTTVYTDIEIEYCMSKKYPYESLAARFAAKEAASKALRVGIGKMLSWKSISVNNDENGAPMLVFDKNANALMSKMSGTRAILSLSHTNSLAQAFVGII